MNVFRRCMILPQCVGAPHRFDGLTQFDRRERYDLRIVLHRKNGGARILHVGIALGKDDTRAHGESGYA